MRGFLVVLALNIAVMGTVTVWGCQQIPPANQPTDSDRDCALEMAVYTLALKLGDDCDHALALAKLAGPKCSVMLSCVDAKARLVGPASGSMLGSDGGTPDASW